MKYFAAIIPFILLLLLDVVLVVSILGLLVTEEAGDFPLSYNFIKKVYNI